MPGTAYTAYTMKYTLRIIIDVLYSSVDDTPRYTLINFTVVVSQPHRVQDLYLRRFFFLIFFFVRTHNYWGLTCDHALLVEYGEELL